MKTILTALLLLTFASVAIAQTSSNTYTIIRATASTGKWDYRHGVWNNQPATYDIMFGNVKIHAQCSSLTSNLHLDKGQVTARDFSNCASLPDPTVPVGTAVRMIRYHQFLTYIPDVNNWMLGEAVQFEILSEEVVKATTGTKVTFSPVEIDTDTEPTAKATCGEK